MKLILLLSLLSTSVLAQDKKFKKPDEKVNTPQKQERKFDQTGERTYSAPVDRIDEYRQEMEIDEERDSAEERARKF